MAAVQGRRRLQAWAGPSEGGLSPQPSSGAWGSRIVNHRTLRHDCKGQHGAARLPAAEGPVGDSAVPAPGPRLGLGAGAIGPWPPENGMHPALEPGAGSIAAAAAATATAAAHSWPPPPRPPSLPPQESLAQLKSDGNSHFAKKEYDAALAAYDKALGMVPADAADAALLHSNKAACHMMQKRCVQRVVLQGCPAGAC